MKRAKTIKEYVHGNQLRKNVHFRYADGSLKFLHKGEWYSADKFNKMYPRYEYKIDNGKGENPNTKLLD